MTSAESLLKKIIKDTKQKQAHKRAAKLGLQLIKVKNVKILKTKEDVSVDDLLVKLKGYTVATQDIALKRRLKTKKTPLITLRAKKFLINQ